jgi:hypothetical protein
MYDLITSSVLFFMLVPGVLITLPPGASILISGLVHAVVFYVVQTYLAQYVPWWGIWVAAVVLVGLRMYMSRPAVPTYGY